ncbi:MAG: serine hydroxymethyltransferase [Patescibacteria group bacterium]
MQSDKIFDLIKQEKQRQLEVLEMIPSENYASDAVMKAVGSELMNKYAEGNPGRRYYQGNEFVDQVESLAEQRVLEAFGLDERDWGANVQPHSGCEANLIAYNAILNPGDKIMSMFLPDGGHLSHGWQLPGKKLTLVSKIYDISFYKVDEKTKLFNYDEIEKQAKLVQPKLIISGGTAYAREIDHERMGKIARNVGAYYLADVSHEAGLIAAGVQASPFLHAGIVTFTTHKTLRGPRGAVILARNDLMPQIDFSVIPGVQGGPHIHTIAGIAVALEETKKLEFKKYSQQVLKNAQVFAKAFEKAGFNVVSGGTDKHLVLLDLRGSEVDAWTTTWAMEYANMVVNRNTVPAETASAYYPSGLRMGTPAITTRGMKEKECKQIVAWMIKVLNYSKKWQMPKDKQERRKFVKEIRKEMQADKRLASIKKQVLELTSKFPLFAW